MSWISQESHVMILALGIKFLLGEFNMKRRESKMAWIEFKVSFLVCMSLVCVCLNFARTKLWHYSNLKVSCVNWYFSWWHHELPILPKYVARLSLDKTSLTVFSHNLISSSLVILPSAYSLTLTCLANKR